MRLLGCQNLQKYERTHWQGSELDVKAQFEQNKREAMQAGVWFGGVLPDTTHAKSASSTTTTANPAITPARSDASSAGPKMMTATSASASVTPNAIEPKNAVARSASNAVPAAAASTSSASPAKRKRSVLLESSSSDKNDAAAPSADDEHVDKKNKSDLSDQAADMLL